MDASRAHSWPSGGFGSGLDRPAYVPGCPGGGMARLYIILLGRGGGGKSMRTLDLGCHDVSSNTAFSLLGGGVVGGIPPPNEKSPLHENVIVASTSFMSRPQMLYAVPCRSQDGADNL